MAMFLEYVKNRSCFFQGLLELSVRYKDLDVYLHVHEHEPVPRLSLLASMFLEDALKVTFLANCHGAEHHIDGGFLR